MPEHRSLRWSFEQSTRPMPEHRSFLIHFELGLTSPLVQEILVTPRSTCPALGSQGIRAVALFSGRQGQ